MKRYSRWLVAAHALIVLCLLVGGIWFYRSQRQQQELEVRNSLEAVANLKVSQIVGWRGAQMVHAGVVMESPFLAKGIAQWLAHPGPEAEEDVRARLESMQRHYHYFDIVLVDLFGQVRLSLASPKSPVHPEESAALAYALSNRQPRLSNLHLGETPFPHLSLAVPLILHDRGGSRPVGALVFRIDARQFLYPLIQSWPAPSKTAETVLVQRDDGSALYLSELRFRKNTALKLRIPLSQTDSPAVMAALGREGLVQGRGLRGIEVVAVLMRIPDTPWFMVAKMDRAEAFAGWRVRSLFLLSLLLGLMALANALLYVLWQRGSKEHLQALYQAEVKLRESERNYRAIVENMNEALFLRDFNRNIIEVNDNASRMLGYTREELVGANLSLFLSPVDNGIGPARQERLLKDGSLVFEAEFVRKDGSFVAVEVSSKVLSREGEGLVQAFVRDITERKRAEEKLRETLAELTLIHQNAPMGMMLLDPYGCVVKANSAAALSAGRLDEEMIGLRAGEAMGCLHHLDDPQGCGYGPPCVLCPARLAVLETLTTGRNQQGIEAWLPFSVEGRREDRCILVSTSHLQIDDIKRVLICAQDITDRKRAEEALRESERRHAEQALELAQKHWQTTFDVVADPIMLLGVDRSIVQCNQALAAFLGDREGPLIGQKCYGVIHGTDCPIENCPHVRAMQTGLREQAEVLEGGRTFIVSVDPVKTPDGRLTGFIHVMHDITARKRVEKALRESETRFRDMAELLPTAIAEVGLDLKVTYANRRGLELFDYSPEDVETGLNILERIVPEDVDLADVKLERLLAGESLEPFEVNLLKKGGSVFVASLEASTIKKDGQIAGIRVATQDITARKRAEEALRESEERFRRLADATFEAVAIHDRGLLLSANDQFFALSGFEPDELIGKQVVPRLVGPSAIKLMLQHFASGGMGPFESVGMRKDGTTFPIEIRFQEMKYEGREVRVAAIRDITDRKKDEEEKEKLQAQLLQAQKMEAVGRLAGGVAHDFNNMLQAIFSHCEIGLEDTASDSRVHERLQEIQKAARRSANLTHQLLAFARKQTIAPTVLDLNEAVQGMIKMLRRLIGEDIDLVWSPGRGLWPLKMDPSQIDQVLANLAVNARDAISGVGRVTIQTENVTLDEVYSAAHAGSAPGQYVLLAVSDNGSGMDPETLKQIFEPFFTTKGLGKGTGLGLATVYGIVKQNHGFIYVYSEPAMGTTFKIYLPRFMGQVSPFLDEPVVETRQGRGERILLVEDDATLLEVGKIVVERLGYRVLTAATPGEALRLAREHAGEIRLLITDVIMPEMNGRDLAERITQFKPGLKCLFMSGYTSDVIAHHGVLDEGVCFIQKPFSMKDLAAKVREVLEI